MRGAVTIGDRAVAILQTPDPRGKAELALQLFADWASRSEGDCETKCSIAAGAMGLQPSAAIPAAPARPARPPLVPPGEVPKRRLGSLEGRIGLLHALAHIELNAIDLAADLMARFGHLCPIPQQATFATGWIKVCADEARHFTLLADRLESLGSYYGALPAHGELWETIAKTSQDVCARLAIAPMVLEARGLDVTPDMIAKLEQRGDTESAAILKIIYEDEIEHVRIGCHWFELFCALHQQNSRALFRKYVADFFPAGLKPPFNHTARAKAGLDQSFYSDLR